MKDSRTLAITAPPQATTPPKAYQTPLLTQLGTIQQLTQGSTVTGTS